MLKASAENPKVAETFRQALERMPSRIFVHAMNDKQRACVNLLMTKVKDTDRTNIVIPGFARATWNGDGHELRVFRASDIERGNALVKIFNDVGLPVTLKDLSAVEGSAAKARANTFELWFGQAKLCRHPAGFEISVWHSFCSTILKLDSPLRICPVLIQFVSLRSQFGGRA